MSMIRFVGRARTYGLVAAAAALAACGSSNNGGTATTTDAGGADATTQTNPDGGGGGSSDAGVDSTSPSTGEDAGEEAGTEPSYLRTDTLAGFSWGADFGSPYDSILGAPLNTTQSALSSTFSTESAPGQAVQNETFTLVASSQDIYNALSISASLSVSTGLANVNAKTSWAQSQQIDTSDLTVLADLVATGSALRITNPTITPQAAALTPEQFYALYGDRYASEIVTGGEMFCLLDIKTFSEADKSSLAVHLGFSYGESSASADFSNEADTYLSNHQVNVSCQYLGFTPQNLVTDLPSLLSAADQFEQGQASDVGSIGTKTLYLLYTAYYGLPGYPGVPAGTAARVAQQAQAASDYLLYDALVNKDFAAYYADSTYSSNPFFVDMKTYDTQATAYMKAALQNSQNPGVAVPTIAADADISNWVATPSVASAAGAVPSYQTYVLKNGIVPKTLADYDIPLHYAYPDVLGNGTLEGTLFTPVQQVPPATSATAQNPPAVNYPLYLINRGGNGGGYVLEYQWDTGNYFLPSVADANGNIQQSAVASALASFSLAGNLGTQYVIVNTANGLVVTDMGTSAGMAATHFAIGNAAQLWGLYLDDGNDNCSTYVPAPSTVDAGAPGGCTQDGNYPSPNCGSGFYAISAQDTNPSAPASGYWTISGIAVGSAVDANGGGGCQRCNESCGYVNCTNTNCTGGPEPTTLFFLVPYNSGTTHAIFNFQGTGSNAGRISWLATDPTITSANTPIQGYGDGPDGGALEEPIVVAAQNDQPNQLWVFIPSANVDTTP